MATISQLSRLINGAQRQVDLSVNALAVSSLIVGGVSGTSLTQAILNNLVTLQNASEVGASLHTHDTIYTRIAALAAVTAGSAGSTLIGDNASYTNFTPSAATVKGALSGIDSALATVGKTNFSDSVFYIYNSTDITKKIALNAAAITTGTTRTISMPDSNVNLGLVATAVQANGTVPFAAAQSMGGFKLTNLAIPTVGTDAVNKNYVDNKVTGLSWRPEVQLLDSVDTTLPTATTTLIDGVTVTNGMRVLFTALTTADNEVYVAAVSGTAITWTVATDGQSGTGVPTAGDTVLVVQGTAYSNATYAYSGSSASWVQTNGAGQIQAGVGLSKSGNTLSVLAATGSAISVASGGVSVTVSASGGIQVASSALSLLLADTSLSTSSTGVKVALAASSGLAVASGLKVTPDGTTTTINGSNQVAVAAAGISAVQMASSAYDQKTIVGGAGTVASVASAPVESFSAVAGQAFTANKTYAVRYGLTANTETAGQLYAADITTTSYDLFWVVGFIQPTAAVAIGGPVTLIRSAALTELSGDAAFVAGDAGKPVYLQAAGNFSTAIPSTSGQAVAKLGIVTATNGFIVDIGEPYVA